MKKAIDKLITFIVLFGMALAGVGLYDHELLLIIAGVVLFIAAGWANNTANKLDNKYPDGLRSVD